MSRHSFACVVFKPDKFSAASNPLVQAVFGGLLIWLVAVRAFRWKRYDAIHQQFQARYEEGIVPGEAQKIVKVSRLYDMPLLMKYAFGFKTYGIVSLSNSA